MARAITFYKMVLDKRYLDKTSGLKNASTINNAHFIDDTEIVNPILKLTEFDEDQCNYVYIPSLSRYYYVSGVTYSKGYYYVNLHVDVLMSFKDAIKKQTVIADRSASQYRQYIDDNILKTEQYRGEYIKPFGNQPFNLNTVNFVLGVLGSQD